MGLGMGILGVRGVQEKVGAWRECGGECVTLDMSPTLPPLALVCQELGAAQRPGFCYLCSWLTCLIRLMGTDQGRGGVELMEIFGLYLRSQELQTMRCTELSTRDPLAGVGTGTGHRGSWSC